MTGSCLSNIGGYEFMRMTAADAKMTDSDESPHRTTHVGFLLIPNFSMLAYACAIEPLRAANLLSGKTLYRWSHISIDGLPSRASNGVDIQPDFRCGPACPQSARRSLTARRAHLQAIATTAIGRCPVPHIHFSHPSANPRGQRATFWLHGA